MDRAMALALVGLFRQAKLVAMADMLENAGSNYHRRKVANFGLRQMAGVTMDKPEWRVEFIDNDRIGLRLNTGEPIQMPLREFYQTMGSGIGYDEEVPGYYFHPVGGYLSAEMDGHRRPTGRWWAGFGGSGEERHSSFVGAVYQALYDMYQVNDLIMEGDTFIAAEPFIGTEWRFKTESFHVLPADEKTLKAVEEDEVCDDIDAEANAHLLA